MLETFERGPDLVCPATEMWSALWNSDLQPVLDLSRISSTLLVLLQETPGPVSSLEMFSRAELRAPLRSFMSSLSWARRGRFL